jgi:ubiquinone/menaquinone biosynthesis C-methylase UbiE
MNGVMDNHYSTDRKTKKYLEFRYKERALFAASKINRIKDLEEINLLDFGAADGLTLIELANVLGAGEYLGIEHNQDLINNAPPLPPNVKLVKGDITRLHCIPNASFDVITALAVIEHLETPILALQEAQRILKLGGIFVATVPVPFWDKITGGNKHHAVYLNKNSFKQLTEKAGLELTDYFRFMWLPIAVLPYLNVSINPKTALKIDSFIGSLGLFNFLFVNQCFVAQKPKK